MHPYLTWESIYESQAPQFDTLSIGPPLLLNVVKLFNFLNVKHCQYNVVRHAACHLTCFKNNQMSMYSLVDTRISLFH